QAAALAAHRLDIALQAELVDHLHQVRLGDAVAPGDLGDGRPPVWMQGEVHQYAEREVGVGREAHGRPANALAAVDESKATSIIYLIDAGLQGGGSTHDQDGPEGAGGGGRYGPVLRVRGPGGPPPGARPGR